VLFIFIKNCTLFSLKKNSKKDLNDKYNHFIIFFFSSSQNYKSCFVVQMI